MERPKTKKNTLQATSFRFLCVGKTDIKVYRKRLTVSDMFVCSPSQKNVPTIDVAIAPRLLGMLLACYSGRKWRMEAVYNIKVGSHETEVMEVNFKIRNSLRGKRSFCYSFGAARL